MPIKLLPPDLKYQLRIHMEYGDGSIENKAEIVPFDSDEEATNYMFNKVKRRLEYQKTIVIYIAKIFDPHSAFSITIKKGC
jgi:predicted ABC-class ATPase